MTELDTRRPTHTLTTDELIDRRVADGVLPDPSDAPAGWLRVRHFGGPAFRWRGSTVESFDADREYEIEIGTTAGDLSVVYERHYYETEIVAYRQITTRVSWHDARESAWERVENYGSREFDSFDHDRPSTPLTRSDGAGSTEPHSAFDYKRYERAMLQSYAAEEVEQHQYHVAGDESAYDVSLYSGDCTCPDATHRSELICKHAILSAIQEFYSDRMLTRFAAQVIAAIRRDRCVFGGSDCNGPCGPTFPCSECIASISVHPKRVWEMTMPQE